MRNPRISNLHLTNEISINTIPVVCNCNFELQYLYPVQQQQQYSVWLCGCQKMLFNNILLNCNTHMWIKFVNIVESPSYTHLFSIVVLVVHRRLLWLPYCMWLIVADLLISLMLLWNFCLAKNREREKKNMFYEMLVKCGIIWIENINSRRFDGGWVNNCNFELFPLTLRFRHIPIWLICYTYICVLIIPDDRRQIDPLSLTMSQRISNVWHRCVRMKLNPKPESFKSFELNGCHQSHAIHTQITHELNTLRSEWNGKIARFYAYRRTQKVEDRKNNNKWKRERERKNLLWNKPVSHLVSNRVKSVSTG